MAPTHQSIEIHEPEKISCSDKIAPLFNNNKGEITVTNYSNKHRLVNDSGCNKSSDDADFDVSKYESIAFKAKIKWPDLIVQVSLHLVSIYGLYLIITNRLKFLTTLFVFITIYTSGFGITAGVHRLWSHRAYKANTPLRIILALLFTVTGQRDIYTWALDHRVHHKYTETVADPHNIKRGFWFAHIGWLVLTPHPAVVNRRKAIVQCCSDLIADPVVRLQKKYFIPLFGLLNIFLPICIPMSLWGETLVNSFIVSFVTRFTITLNIAFCVNSFAHLWGNKPYDNFIKSVENSFVSLAALGEGWHNYHHVFPWDYRTSELGRINISTTFIDTFAKIGWAYDLKAATASMIKSRAEKCGDGSFHHQEEPVPISNFDDYLKTK